MTSRFGRAALRAAMAALVLLAAACDGENPWDPDPPGGGGGGGGNGAADQTRPVVDILIPNDELGTVAVGDSVLVRFQVQENHRVGTVTIEGFAVRGDPALGTDHEVERFVTKTIEFSGRAVQDTTLDRYLNAAADTLPEGGVFIVVTATDSTGNPGADTVAIDIGGPSVALTVQDDDGTVAEGTSLAMRVVAGDARDLVNSVTVRGTGAFDFEQTLQFSPARAALDTVLTVPVPMDAVEAAPEDLVITASVRSGANLSGTAAPVRISVEPAAQDVAAPRVTMQFDLAGRVEQRDSFSVDVSAVDEVRVDSVGVTVLAIRRGPGAPDTLRAYVGRGGVAGGTFRFAYAALGLSTLDTATVDLEITGWAVDASGNCGSATVQSSAQQLPCAGTGGVRLSASGPGRLVRVFVARGQTVAPPNTGDLIADVVADGRYVYLSNYTRNRVDLLPLGGSAYDAPVRVGSQPWGMAVGRTGDSLYVANSGGTNISVIPLGAAVLQEAQDRRIFTRNEVLFGVEFNPANLTVQKVTLHDYSDRPQFVAQADNGLLVFSTRPTPAAEDGTVRIYDPAKLRSEIVIGYVDRHTPGRAIVVNADSAFQVGAGLVEVCPRRRFGDTRDADCILGDLLTVSDSLTTLRAQPANASGGRWDARLDIGADILEVGFADTTFVAASGDRNYIAVGEGVRENARIPIFEADGDSLLLRGDVRDLISNAAERVIGLGLNLDGSLGVARGEQAYFFTNRLRLQGTVNAGTPTGGVAMHPGNAGYPGGSSRLAFVSGIDARAPYIDVIDTFNFFRVKRIYMRDPVVGALAVAPRAASDPASVVLRLYALTANGIVGLTVTSADLN